MPVLQKKPDGLNNFPKRRDVYLVMRLVNTLVQASYSLADHTLSDLILSQLYFLRHRETLIGPAPPSTTGPSRPGRFGSHADPGPVSCEGSHMVQNGGLRTPAVGTLCPLEQAVREAGAN